MLGLPVVSLHVATSPELHQITKNGDVTASQILQLSFPVLGKLTVWTSGWPQVHYCQSVQDLSFLTYLCHILKAELVLHFCCTYLVICYGPPDLRWSWLPNVKAARLLLLFLTGFSASSSVNIIDCQSQENLLVLHKDHTLQANHQSLLSVLKQWDSVSTGLHIFCM